MTSNVAAARVAAAWLATEFLAQNGAGVTARELADASGLSERTFYRYFPRREDVLRPAMRDAQDEMARAVDAQPESATLGGALLEAFAAVAEGAHMERTRRLLPVVFASERHAAVWSQELRQHHPLLRAAVAKRLGCAPGDLRAEVAVTLFLSLVELALSAMVSTGEAPASLLAARMRIVGSSLFDTIDGLVSARASRSPAVPLA